MKTKEIIPFGEDGSNVLISVRLVNHGIKLTLPQITRFITIAQESEAKNLLPALMDYKNKNFADYNPMDEFTLEW